MNTRTITKSILILSAPMIMGTVYTPIEKQRPTKDFIDQYYMNNGYHSKQKSEQRKQLLNTIREAKKQIALTYKTLRMVHKTIDCCVQEITERSNENIKAIVNKRAQELRVPVKYIRADQVAKRKGIMIINEFELS